MLNKLKFVISFESFYNILKILPNIVDKFFLHKTIIALIGLTGVCVLGILTTYNSVGITPDSVYYISVARNIADGRGFIGYDGYKFILQPPLYPILLALIDRLFYVDPLISAGYLNSILFGILIYFSGLILLNKLRCFYLTVIGTISVSVSVVMVILFLLALSEPLFILLVVLYLYYFEAYRANSSITNLILFSVAASLACLTRYAGVIIIFVGLCSIIITERKSLKPLLNRSLLFALISSLPAGIWILRNFLVSGTLTGGRAGSSYSLSQNIFYFFNTLTKWYLPIQFTSGILYSLLVLAAVAFGIYFFTKGDLHKIQSIKTNWPVMIFILFYSLTIIISSTTTAYDKIADRILSPIFVPATILLFLVLDEVLFWIRKRVKYSRAGIIFVCLTALWLLHPFFRTMNIVSYYIKESGWELSGNTWSNNSVIKYLNNNTFLRPGDIPYSNYPDAVYFFTNRQTKWSPEKTYFNSPQIKYNTPELKSSHKYGDRSILIWFNNADRQFLFQINDLCAYLKLSKIVSLKDGVIYMIDE